MISLRNVSKSYKKHEILNDISHDFGTGLHILVGPSGAGKSTLLQLCATVERPSSGILLWNGKPYFKEKRQIRRHLGYAPQIVDLQLNVTGLEFLMHIAALKGLHRGAKEQALHILEQVGLSSAANQRVMVWSGGMRRRLILAQALLGSPKILALDEPTAELDGETARRVSMLISDAAKTATVLVTTHLSGHFNTPNTTILRVENGKLGAS